MQQIGSLYLFNIRPACGGVGGSHGFIAKYGFTKDLARRTREHARAYKPDPIFLVCQARINVALLREAEDQLRYELKGMHIGPQTFGLYNIPRGREIVMVPWSDIDWVKHVYENIEKDFDCLH